MISIRRDPEPEGLAAVRDTKLAQAREAINRGEKLTFDAYDCVKPALAAMQSQKCCYCEKREEQAKYRDVEHYRPKSTYWWLAWTWDNLLFSCIDCNREQKRDQFPLSPGDEALVAEQQPPGKERPLVIDPASPGVDPTTEIRFVCEKVNRVERWVPRGLTDRGRRTVRVCGLNRPALLDLYLDHVIHRVRPRRDALFQAIDEGGAREIVHAWSRTTRGLLGAARPFRALSHDALAVLVPPEVRDRFNLVLQRPTRRP